VRQFGNGNLLRRWIPYYVLAPFQGAALAVLVYLLPESRRVHKPPPGVVRPSKHIAWNISLM